MSNNKQTAVEWLIDELSKFEKGESEYFSTTIIKNKAIRMEKQQIMKAYGQGIADEAGEILDATKDAQQYYNETYKSE